MYSKKPVNLYNKYYTTIEICGRNRAILNDSSHDSSSVKIANNDLFRCKSINVMFVVQNDVLYVGYFPLCLVGGSQLY